MPKIRSIMKTDVLYVKEDTTIRDTAALLLQNSITGVPVLGQDMKVVGIVTEKDIFKVLYRAPTKDESVRKIMTKEVVTFDTNDDFVDHLCECLIENVFRRIVILSNGKLAGVVSRTDIVAYIMGH